MDTTSKAGHGRWDELKEELHDLYVVKDMPLKNLMTEMESRHQFIASKSQYETQLKKKWGFRKYLKAKGEQMQDFGRQFALAQKSQCQISKNSFEYHHPSISRPLKLRNLRRRGALTAHVELEPELYSQDHVREKLPPRVRESGPKSVSPSPTNSSVITERPIPTSLAATETSDTLITESVTFTSNSGTATGIPRTPAHNNREFCHHLPHSPQICASLDTSSDPPASISIQDILAPDSQHRSPLIHPTPLAHQETLEDSLRCPMAPTLAFAYPRTDLLNLAAGPSSLHVTLPRLNPNTIITAILELNFPLATYLIDTGEWDLNVINDENETALTASIRVRNPHLTERLISHQAAQVVPGNICSCGSTSNASALVAAAEAGDERYIGNLSQTLAHEFANLPGTLSLDYAFDDTRFCRCVTPLTAAIFNGSHSMLRTLLAKGAWCFYPAPESLVSGVRRPVSPFLVAITAGEDECLKALLKSGAAAFLDANDIKATTRMSTARPTVFGLLIDHLADERFNPQRYLGSLLLDSIIANYLRCGNIFQSTPPIWRYVFLRALSKAIAMVDGDERFQGDPPSPLFTALSGNCLELVICLKNFGADYNTPLWYKSSHDGSVRSTSALRRAVERNLDIDLIGHLLKSGANDFCRQPQAVSLIEMSAQNCNPAVTKLLLNHKFDPNSATGFYRTALQHAIINEDFSTARLLLQHGANVNLYVVNDTRAPLAIATELKDLNMARLLLRHGADPDGRSNKLIADSDNDTCLSPLQIAAKSGSLDILNLLLQHNAQQNRRNPIWYRGSATHIDAFLSPLQLAICSNETVVIERLLAHGADVNDRASGRTLFNPKVSLLEARQTPLQLAVSKNRVEIVNILLSNTKVDINAPAHQQGGATALQYAAMTGSISIAKALIEKGANVNAPAAEHGGRTAVEAAAEHGRLDMLNLLFESGAVVYRSDCAKAVSLARSKGHMEAVELLKKKFTLYYS
ncbi:ankyrin repeat-containing domain protein [Podospora fimiseda]|uniref:Ankyrin repeat-containing domain protein n=1 Tax=Podospora fimiseda TaxID=252190 RepID=A0AAN7BF58_9PEZI|nr:ankyrin repeat-containing domain protein [Podospora fimiseda]